MSAQQSLVAIPENPGAEDHLFDTGLVKVHVDVTPEWRRSPQGDLMLRGFIAGKEIEVVFHGRRQVSAGRLTQWLHSRVEQAKRTAKASGRVPSVVEVRQKLLVDGVWRVRLLAEQNGMPVRRFQLYAARWRFHGADGAVHMNGEVPYG